MDKIIQITANSEGKIVFAKDNIILEDQSRITFETENIDSFIGRVKCYAETIPQVVYFHNNLNIVSYNGGEKVTQHLVPTAKCVLHRHTVLQRVTEMSNDVLPLEDMEMFLNQHKIYLDPAGLNLLDNIRDFSVNKVMKYTRKKDRKGNMGYSFTRESGAGDFSPPEQITITCPIFGYYGALNIGCFVFEPEITLKQDEKEGIQIFFSLLNPQITEIVEETIRKNLIALLEGLGKKILVSEGSIKLYPQTDEWKYKNNTPDIRGL